MDKTPQETNRRFRASLGAGLYRVRQLRPHSWSEDWPFQGRSAANGPSESFEGAVKPGRRQVGPGTPPGR